MFHDRFSSNLTKEIHIKWILGTNTDSKYNNIFLVKFSSFFDDQLGCCILAISKNDENFWSRCTGAIFFSEDDFIQESKCLSVCSTYSCDQGSYNRALRAETPADDNFLSWTDAFPVLVAPLDNFIRLKPSSTSSIVAKSSKSNSGIGCWLYWN